MLADDDTEIEIDMKFDASVVKYVSKAGFDEVYGARPLKRTIQSKVEDVLSEEILDSEVEKGKSYVCSCTKDGKLKVKEA